MTRLNWKQLLNDRRFSEDLRSPAVSTKITWLVDTRRPIERDYDRVLFSTPTRRMADKTQVFPLEKNESIRSRLTHSHEVSNLARSFGVHLAHGKVGQRIANDLGESSAVRVTRDIPAMLSAIGLAHDLGNPPFGHQGELAVRSWFASHSDLLEKVDLDPYEDKKSAKSNPAARKLKEEEREDFLKFEGNAQTLRVLTRLQVVHDDLGLNLTYGTLAAVMKYTRASNGKILTENKSTDKIGHFLSERKIVEKIWEQTGLQEGVRHPFAFVVEACDDIAYLVLDAEDAVKKKVVSFSDVINFLSRSCCDDVSEFVLSSARDDHAQYAKEAILSPSELNDISMQKFRVHAINALMSLAIREFEKNYDAIMDGRFKGELLKSSKAAPLAEQLRTFDREHAYKHRDVLALELTGYRSIHGLMDILWEGIVKRKSFVDVGSKRTAPLANFSYLSISENYRRIFEGKVNGLRKGQPNLPIRYRELQLLADSISGMTDGYVVELCNTLRKYSSDGRQ